MDNNIKQRIDEITNEISKLTDLNIKHASLTYMEQQAAFLLWQMEDEKHIDNDAFKGVEAIIMSMTPYEREHPEVINGSRRKRIADGSGTSLPEVNRLLKQFEGTRKVMKTAMTGNLMQKMKGFRR